MLFRKNIEPQCVYCKNGKKLWDGVIGCEKNGIMSDFDSCDKFRYDPYSRVPEKPKDTIPQLDETLFSLDGK